MKRTCENCRHKADDYCQQLNSHIVKIPFCAANRPEFPVAFHCPSYEPIGSDNA